MCDEYYSPEFELMLPSHRRVVLLQSRQTGKTTTTAAIFAWYLTFHNDKNAMVVANKGDTAEEILGKMSDVLKGLPFFLKPGVTSVSQEAIRFENGCSLRCAATGEAPATGDTLHMLMIDECALIPANKIGPFWRSVFPTLSSSNLSQIIVLSTPRGRHNLYYQIYKGAVDGTNGFVHKRVDYWEVPGHDTEEWKQEQISAFGEAFFNQEFGLSFDSDESKLISPQDLKFFNRIKQIYQSVEIYGIPYRVSQKILWHPNFHPDKLTPRDLLTRRFVLQIDTAEGQMSGEKGKEDPDYNVINILEVELMSPIRIKKNRLGYKKVDTLDVIRFRQVGVYIDHEFDEEKCAEAAQYITFVLFKNGCKVDENAIAYMGGDNEVIPDEYDNVRIMLEVNFNGVNFIKIFRKHDLYFPNLFIKTFHSQKATNKEIGFKTVGGNHGKSYYCEQGAKFMQRRQIIISQDNEIPNLSGIQQLEAFSKTKNGTYKGSGMHDDIAVTCLFVSILMEEDSFKLWCEEWINLISNVNHSIEMKEKIKKIMILMETYVTDTVEDEYTEDDIVDLFKTSSSGFNGNNMNPYGNDFGNGFNGNNFGGYGGNQGYGGYNGGGFGNPGGYGGIIPRRR